MSEENQKRNAEMEGLRPYLSPWAVLALSFGYAVGWGAFVMPGNVFLPKAGPLGTIVGIAIGALAMGLFALNYHRMVLREPGPGGAFRFTRKLFGDDHGFTVAWFLCLTYVAILWANATSFSLFDQYFLGGALRFGFHYTMVGFDVYFGEVLMAVLVIAVTGAACLYHRRLAGHLQEILAAVFVLCVGVCFFAALGRHDGGLVSMAPAFAPGGNEFIQVIAILAMMPWAFVGFEAVSNSSAEFNFPAKKLLPILIAAIVLSALVYSMLALLPTLAMPEGYASWSEYLGDLSANGSVGSKPVFEAARLALGPAGTAVLGGALLAAQLTGVVAAYIALSRLMYSMSLHGALPKWFGVLGSDGAPKNAILFIMCASFVVPFFGRTVVSWPIDVSSIGAAMAYGYTSIAAFKAFGSVGKGKIFWMKASGLAGAVIAVLLCLLLLVPNYALGSSLSPESYLLLAIWCLLGFVIYRRAFRDDTKNRFGHSTIVWVAVQVLIFFSSLMWVRQAACNATEDIVQRVQASGMSVESLEAEMALARDAARRNSLIEMSLLVVSLSIMLSLYSLLRKREQAMALEKAEAERVNKAKSFFFSTVSHDIRTPLNAIIGFSQMLKMGFKTDAERDQAVDSILVSGKTLLCLINDVLDLSKLESGRMTIEPEPVSCQKLLREIVESFKIASQKPHLEVRGKVDDMPPLMLDPQRIRQIAFNLVGNASKFTHEGYIEVRASFAAAEDGETGTFTLDVEDTGCGISEEDQKKIASPYVQVGSKASRHGGTGLGLAICRQLARAMGGDMTLKSELGKGSTFSIVVPGVRVCKASELETGNSGSMQAGKADGGSFAVQMKRRILVADDQKMNRMLLKAMLAKIGAFDVVTAADGKEALGILEAPDAPAFDVVLTDMWMPDMDGEALVRAIRANPKIAGLPVYVLTADVEMRETFANIGFTGLLLKPVTFDGLKGIVEG